MTHNCDRDGYHCQISRLTGKKIRKNEDIRKLECIPEELKKSDLRKLDDLKKIVDFLENQ